MKTNGKHEVIARIARQSLVLAALFAMMLSAASISRAQSSAASPATAAAKSAAVSAKSPASPAAKGQSEGIKVHGHWTIEVKNPDGKLVTHREFENGLAGISGGAPVLAGILSRAVTVGSWQVYLGVDAGGDDPLVIDEPNSTAATACPSLTAGWPYSNACFNNLSVTGAQLGTGGISSGTLTGNTVTLNGSATVPTGYVGPIRWVATQNFLCSPSDTPTACFSDSNALQQSLTTRNLDGQGTDPAPVSVTSGQLISVTVVLSFGSGN